jgi:carboxypeptidase Q
VLAAAKAIHISGVRPARTIRFVLFTGEEQGLLGSKAYGKQHRAELPNIDCALIMDWGAARSLDFRWQDTPKWSNR